MSPRPYNSARRREAAEATRERIVAAAHALLADPVGVSAFTLEAVAKRVGDNPATIYKVYAHSRRTSDRRAAAIMGRALDGEAVGLVALEGGG